MPTALEACVVITECKCHRYDRFCNMGIYSLVIHESACLLSSDWSQMVGFGSWTRTTTKWSGFHSWHTKPGL